MTSPRVAGPLLAIHLLLAAGDLAAGRDRVAPVGVALGMPAPLLIGVYPAVNGNFFLPTYGTVLAAVSFDRTGTTRIGKYLLNHSFMVPGLVTTFSATCAALLLARVLL